MHDSQAVAGMHKALACTADNMQEIFGRAMLTKCVIRDRMFTWGATSSISDEMACCRRKQYACHNPAAASMQKQLGCYSVYACACRVTDARSQQGMI